MLDLSALHAREPSSVEGKPIELPLSEIEEDPHQPRREFDETALSELVASIQERGVLQPVSVRPHPSKPGKWILNFGARRVRASRAAGKTTIPAFMDETHQDFDQVVENEQRDNLKPMELALFINKKLEEGFNKAAIARQLGKPPTSINKYLAFLNLPSGLDRLYQQGLCTSPETMYWLRTLHEQYPQPVEHWCANAGEVTRKRVATLAQELAPGPQELVTMDDSPEPTETESVAFDDPPSAAGEPPPQGEGLPSTDDAPLPQFEEKQDPAVLQPNRTIKNLLVLVRYQGKTAQLILNRRPSDMMHVWIKMQRKVFEVPIQECKLLKLTE